MTDDEDELLDDDTDEQVEEKVEALLVALDGAGVLPPPTPTAFVPPGLRAAMADNYHLKQSINEQLAAQFNPPTIDEIKARVHRELDPIGMAIAIAQGMTIPVYFIKDGMPQVKYIQVGNRERLSILKKLMDLVTRTEKSEKETRSPLDDPSNAHAFLAMAKRAGQVAEQALSKARIINVDTASVLSPPHPEEEDALDGA